MTSIKYKFLLQKVGLKKWSPFFLGIVQTQTQYKNSAKLKNRSYKIIYITLRGRINFMQLGRYSSYNESTFRRNFAQAFDFLAFNQALVSEVCGGELAIAFDPSFIAKSGKHTPGLAYFWSGCADKAKKGLEIAGFEALDIERNTCFHLVAYQSLDIG